VRAQWGQWVGCARAGRAVLAHWRAGLITLVIITAERWCPGWGARAPCVSYAAFPMSSHMARW
jgi:hypothetical protein